MPLTPEEIADREFLVGLRGYDKDEVRAFLRAVAEAFHTASSPAPVEGAGEGDRPAIDWSNLGEEISTVLRTAHEQAAGLRADASAESARIRAEAESEASRLKAEAEQQRVEAAQELATAQERALGMVADAQARIEKMTEAAMVKAQDDAKAAVAHLDAQLHDLTGVRDTTRHQLGDLRQKIDAALAAPQDRAEAS